MLNYVRLTFYFATKDYDLSGFWNAKFWFINEAIPQTPCCFGCWAVTSLWEWISNSLLGDVVIITFGPFTGEIIS